MTTPLIPQEIYLLERYASLPYFGRLRDEFAATVEAAEEALVAFMRQLPPDYRSRPLHEQPDAVWGERVLPNLRWTLQGLNTGYMVLAKGDLDALGMAGNVRTAFGAISRDYETKWMAKAFEERYNFHSVLAHEAATNVSFTSLGEWGPGTLGLHYSASARGNLNAPPTWPIYRLDPDVRVKTGDKVPSNGVYLPDLDASAPQLLIEGYDAWDACIRDPANPQRRIDHPTTWTLVERIADSGGGIPGATNPLLAGIRLRCEAGQACPQTGFWFTPAHQDSRRQFAAGEIMPDVGGDFGVTIWQWDEQQ